MQVYTAAYLGRGWVGHAPSKKEFQFSSAVGSHLEYLKSLLFRMCRPFQRLVSVWGKIREFQRII